MVSQLDQQTQNSAYSYSSFVVPSRFKVKSDNAKCLCVGGEGRGREEEDMSTVDQLTHQLSCLADNEKPRDGVPFGRRFLATL